VYGEPALRVQLPAPRTPVALLTVSGERIPAWVQRVEQHALTIVATLPLPLMSADALARTMLEFGMSGGRARVVGRLEPLDTRSPELLLLRDPRVLEFLQERAFPRVPVSLPVGLALGRERYRAYTVDAGAGGCLLEGAGALRTGQSVHFQLRLRALEPPLHGAARVVRVDRRGRRGLVFDAIAGGRSQQLEALIAERLHAHARV
jgi:hypothetical protein